VLLKHQKAPELLIVGPVSSCDNEAIKQKHKPNKPKPLGGIKNGNGTRHEVNRIRNRIRNRWRSRTPRMLRNRL
jgi:hypothetical protein